MTFRRPKDTTLTEMARCIDEGDLIQQDYDKLVEYLYHLVFYNAQQKSFFRDIDIYDDFALFCVSKLLVRICNKEIDPIKSIVNYINNVLPHWYAEYIRTFCCGSPDADQYNFDVSDFADYLIDEASYCDKDSYSSYCLKVSDVVKHHLLQIPYKNNSSEWSNIYTSCLLTLQDRIESAITLCGNLNNSDEDVSFSRVVRGLKTRPPVLFHLNDSMSTYVSVLVNEIIHAISAELSYSTASKVTASTCLQNLIIAANNEED